MFGDAIYYPSGGEQSAITLGIGGVLTVLSFLLLPLLFVFGYLIRVLERSASGDEDVPQFDDWGDLAVKGIVGAVITAVFYLVPVAAFAAFGGIGVLTGSAEAAVASLGVAGIAGALLFLALTYVYPAALTNYAATGEIGAAFAFGEIANVIRSESYLGAWLVGFVLFLGGFLLMGLLSLIPVVGTIVALFLNFYIQVAAYRAFGVAFEQSTSARTTPTADAAAA